MAGFGAGEHGEFFSAARPELGDDAIREYVAGVVPLILPLVDRWSVAPLRSRRSSATGRHGVSERSNAATIERLKSGHCR